MSNIIEKRVVNGEYGFLKQQIIIDIEKHGRMLVSEGFGGNSLDGQLISYRHGFAVSLKPTDTFEALDELISEDNWLTKLDCAIQGFDSNRQLQEWDGHVIEKLIDDLGGINA